MGPVEVATVWAAVWRQRLKDRINNLGEGITNKITFVVRQNLPFKITNDMTISHKGTEYKIVDVYDFVFCSFMGDRHIICNFKRQILTDNKCYFVGDTFPQVINSVF